MSSARTIEEYVEEIMEMLQDSDLEGLTETCDTLEKMKYNTKDKYKVMYWRVMQCLGEVSVDKQVKYLENFQKTSCKCHFARNLTCFMRLFVETMCNVAVIKRILSRKDRIVPVLFKAVRQTDEELLVVLALEGVYKCLIVGKTEISEIFVKYGLLKDLYHRVKAKNDTSVYSYGAINIVLSCTKILYVISLCGTENIQRQVKRSHVLRVVGDYVQKLASNKIDRLGVQTLTEKFTLLKTILTDEKSACKLFEDWNPKEELRLEQEQDKLYLFCSAPVCRKPYEASIKFRYCGACRLARYCSETCQKDHWKKSHKETCLRDTIEVD